MTPQRQPLAAIGTRIARWRLRSTARIADPIRAGHHREMWIEFYEDSLVTPAPRRSEPAIAHARFIFILAVAAEDLQWFPEVPFTRLHVKDTSQAVDAIRQGHARLAAVDGDLPDFDVPAICEAARRSGGTAVLVTISAPTDAPKVLKAGCHGNLLKPYARNLLAARMGP